MDGKCSLSLQICFLFFVPKQYLFIALVGGFYREHVYSSSGGAFRVQAFICAAAGPRSDGSGGCRLASTGASPQQM